MTFDLDLRQLAFYDRELQYVVEPGELSVWVGSSSEDLRLEASVEVSGERQVVAADEARPTAVSVSQATASPPAPGRAVPD